MWLLVQYKPYIMEIRGFSLDYCTNFMNVKIIIFWYVLRVEQSQNAPKYTNLVETTYIDEFTTLLQL